MKFPQELKDSVQTSVSQKSEVNSGESESLMDITH